MSKVIFGSPFNFLSNCIIVKTIEQRITVTTSIVVPMLREVGYSQNSIFKLKKNQLFYFYPLSDSFDSYAIR